MYDTAYVFKCKWNSGKLFTELQILQWSNVGYSISGSFLSNIYILFVHSWTSLISFIIVGILHNEMVTTKRVVQYFVMKKVILDCMLHVNKIFAWKFMRFYIAFVVTHYPSRTQMIDVHENYDLILILGLIFMLG